MYASWKNLEKLSKSSRCKEESYQDVLNMKHNQLVGELTAIRCSRNNDQSARSSIESLKALSQKNHKSDFRCVDYKNQHNKRNNFNHLDSKHIMNQRTNFENISSKSFVNNLTLAEIFYFFNIQADDINIKNPHELLVLIYRLDERNINYPEIVSRLVSLYFDFRSFDEPSTGIYLNLKNKKQFQYNYRKKNSVSSLSLSSQNSFNSNELDTSDNCFKDICITGLGKNYSERLLSVDSNDLSKYLNQIDDNSFFSSEAFRGLLHKSLLENCSFPEVRSIFQTPCTSKNSSQTEISEPSTARSTETRGIKMNSKNKTKHYTEKVSKSNIPDEHNITTVMVRNIGSMLTNNCLRKWLDHNGFAHLYDFLYVPREFTHSGSKGYAFINFIETETVKLFESAVQGKPWPYGDSKKPIEISPAVIQGTHENLLHLQKFRNNRVKNPGFRPLIRIEGNMVPAG